MLFLQQKKSFLNLLTYVGFGVIIDICPKCVPERRRLMARPRKFRRVCRLPKVCEFKPIGAGEGFSESVYLTIDEYEAMRLIDLEEYTQEECSLHMGIARTTVQGIYISARKKIAQAIVLGKRLVIEGGEFELCENFERPCGRICFSDCEKTEVCCDIFDLRSDNMKIAVCYSKGDVFQHFGKTEEFKIFNISEGKIVGSEVIGSEGNGHGKLAGFLKEKGVDALICGGIGGGALNALAEAGVKVFPGVSGNADEAAKDFAEGKLNFNINAKCNHHDHEHSHEHGHSCGHSHGKCGE